MAKAIIFDFWGTLIANGTYSPLKQSQRILDVELPYGEFVERFERAAMIREFETQEEVFQSACKEFGVEPGKEIVDRLIGVWNKNKLLAKPFPGVMSTLQELREKGVKLAILSNTPVFSARAVIEKFEMEQYFDVISLSCEIGMLKTDKAAFDMVLEKLGVAASEAIMVGDSIESDMEGAKNAGVQGVLIDRRGRREFSPKIHRIEEVMDFV